MSSNPTLWNAGPGELAQDRDYPSSDEFYVCGRCEKLVREDEDCPACGPEPCLECRQPECECDRLADEPAP